MPMSSSARQESKGPMRSATPIERGRHALRSSMDVKAYAESVGRERPSVQTEVEAAGVADAVMNVHHDLDLNARWLQLRAIHAAPEWLWSGAGLRRRAIWPTRVGNPPAAAAGRPDDRYFIRRALNKLAARRLSGLGRFDRDLTDIFAVQDDVTGLRLSESAPTISHRAIAVG
jgi:hypothetical protein